MMLMDAVDFNMIAEQVLRDVERLEKQLPLGPIDEAVRSHQMWLKSLLGDQSVRGDRLVADGMDLSQQSFAGQDLRGASFRDCNLRGCDFSGAKVDHADFSQSDLRDCRFSHCDLSKADISGANIKGVKYVDPTA